MGTLYHGSVKHGIKVLEPRLSTHGKYVYATPYKELAIIFSGCCGDDHTYALYRNDVNKPYNLVERIPNAFKVMYNNSSSIYTLDKTNFKDIHTGFSELVSEKSVKVIKEEYIKNVFEEIKKLNDEGKINLYLYPNKPKDIPSDNSDLIDKQIKVYQIHNKDITKQSFERLLLLHPYLLDKINKKMVELNINDNYKKDDIISLYNNAVKKQKLEPKKEQYLESIKVSISNTFPEFRRML